MPCNKINNLINWVPNHKNPCPKCPPPLLYNLVVKIV